jgi:hypothetical protein
MKILSGKNILQESLSRVVYHYTEVYKLKSILQSNKFTLTSSLGANIEDYHTQKGFFYASLARTGNPLVGYPRSEFGTASGNRAFVRIEVDGSKLNQRFKGSPVDYWQRKDFDKLKQNLGGDGQAAMDRMLKDFEHEDRLFSDKGAIENFKNYILGISIYLPADSEDMRKVIEVKDCIELGQRLGVAVNVYSDVKLLAQNRPEGVINDKVLSMDTQGEKGHDRSVREGVDDSLLRYAFAVMFYSIDIIQGGLEAVKSKVGPVAEKLGIELTNDLLYKILDTMSKLSHGENAIREIHSSLTHEVRLHTQKPSDEINRKVIEVLIKAVRSSKASNLFEFMDSMVKGIKPKGAANSVDYSQSYILKDKAYNDVFDNGSPIKDIWSLSMSTYRTYLDGEIGERVYNESRGDNTVGQYINFLLNTFTEEKAKDLIKRGSDGDIELLKVK